jgi:hypothetical protein
MAYTQKQAKAMHELLQDIHMHFRHARLGLSYGMFATLGPIKVVLNEEEAVAIRQWASLKEK